MSYVKYKFKEIENEKWGIYDRDRLLATISSYEACQSMGQLLSNNDNLSHLETIKATIAYKQAINKSLIIN